MKSILLILLFLFPIMCDSQILRDDTPLGEVVIFGELHMLLPTSVLEDSLDGDKQALIEVFEDLGKRKMQNERGDLLISFDKRERGVSKQSIKNLMERFARNLYRGTIYRNEEMEINGLEIYILDIIGYWNGAKTPSSILSVVVFTETNSYDISLRYPEEDFDYSDAVKEEMIYSIRVEKKD